MGGLTALMLADAEPDRLLSFIDIEGNVAPEDCFLSRQLVEFPAESTEHFSRTSSKERGMRLTTPPHFMRRASGTKYGLGAVRGIFTSMVELSDHGDLMRRFLSLRCPRMFMYGEQNEALSYLPKLREHGVSAARVGSCGHFPMYSNPVEMWRLISEFFSHLED